MRWRLGLFKRADRARVADGTWNGNAVRLIKPQTYMNRSGAVLAPLRARADFDASRDLLIVVDDVALPVGRFRLRGAGSAGGHNGLKSVEGVLQRQDYARLRIGVGPVPETPYDLADFVLGEFSPEDYVALTALLDPIADAAQCWLEEGIERAMTRFNR